MLKVKSKSVEVHGEKVTVKAMFELVSVRCLILSIDRCVGKEVVDVMEHERRYKSYKKNRDESELSEACPREDPPAVTVRETTMPRTRRFSHK